jgi:dGTPase
VSLNGLLKYPDFRRAAGKGHDKWGSYHTEEHEFQWVRDRFPLPLVKSVEAELMDWADDIAYSVHDVDDFYRAGIIPLDKFQTDEAEADSFIEAVFDRAARERREPPLPSREDAKRVLGSLLDSVVRNFPLEGPFRGTTAQRSQLRSMTSLLVSRYITDGISLNDPAVSGVKRFVIRDEQFEAELSLLKQLVWHYVIQNPALATQQYGQRKVIAGLFRTLVEAAGGNRDIFPARYREELERGSPYQRVVVDMVSGMTEREAIRLYQRLIGVSLGSVLDPLLV